MDTACKTSEKDFQYTVVDVCGFPTQLLQCGNNLEAKNNHTLILIIPGNPGIIQYYEPFMLHLYHRLDKETPVHGISHAGHVSLLTSNYKTTSVADIYSLSGQVEHKISFIKRHIPATTKLILVGHSIGAYIVLEIMKNLPDHNICKGFLLFPTIERLAESPQGVYATPLARYLRWITYPIMFFISSLPSELHRRLISWYFKGRGVADSAIAATLNLADHSVFQNVAYMGHTEMQSVVDPDVETIEKNLDKLLFYYGIDDQWCPVSYYEDMKAKFPRGDIRLCDEGFAHAFVLEHGPQLADKLLTWFTQELQKIEH